MDLIRETLVMYKPITFFRITGTEKALLGDKVLLAELEKGCTRRIFVTNGIVHCIAKGILNEF